MNWARRYLAVSLLAIIAVSQFALVYSASLTRWRGGGFGMYSDFHERHNDLWVELADFADADLATVRADSALQLEEDEAYRSHTFSTQKNLQAVGDQLSADEIEWAQIGLWRFDFDPGTMRFSRTLVVGLANKH